jgi:hypothetical protein
MAKLECENAISIGFTHLIHIRLSRYSGDV